MTIDEFNNTAFHANTWVNYQGENKYVISVDFEEALLGLTHDKIDTPPDEWKWVRCENISLVETRHDGITPASRACPV